METEEEIKKLTPIDLLNLIDGPYIPWDELSDELQKFYSPYLVNRYISSKEMYTSIIAYLDTLKLSPKQHYIFIKNIIDNNRKHYFDYKAYKKSDSELQDNLLIFSVCREYEIGKKDALNNYIPFLTKEIKQELKDKWEEVYKLKK